MADDSSNLRAEIAFLKNLIKFHKQTTPQDSGSGVHSHTVNNDSSKNSRSFSWQRAKQQESETKQPLLRPPLNHVKGQARKVNSSYSLDRRKMNSNTSDHQIENSPWLRINQLSWLPPKGHAKEAKLKIIKAKNDNYNVKDNGQNTTVTTANVPVTPGSSGLSQTLKDTKSFSDSKGVLKQNDTRTTLSIPQAQKSVNMTRNSSSSQPTLGLTAKNPYVLNKRGTFPVSSVKAVAQKSDLKWTKPRATSVISSEDSRSHSDSELYTKKSLLPSSGVLAGMPFTKVKSSTVIHHKAPSTSNVQGSFKWSKTRPSISSSKEPEKSTKKSKPARSKLKWTKSGAQVEVKKQLNPYILRKEITEGGSAGQRQRLTLPKTKKLENPRQRYSTPQNQTAHVRRNKVQLNMESVASKKLLSRSSAGFVERRQRTVQGESPVVTRYSVVRSKRKQAPIKAQKLNKVVVIGGVAYKTSSNKLTKAKASSAEKESGKGSKKVGKLTKTVIIQGEKFVSDSKGKTLQRINKAPRRTSLNEPSSSKVRQTPSGRRRSSNARMVILRTPTTLVRSKLNNTPSKTLASRVLRRSIHNARLYKKNKNEPASQQYCMFYNRFGKCNKRNTCPYIHDPSKVAVCTKFLRGRCKNVDGSCPFSHKIDPDKMPVCQFFLRGKCSNDNCPYSHVNVSKKAKVCEDFLKGFCARGQQCNKKHILECEEFSRTGKCSQGSKCKLMHKARKPIAAHKRKSSYKEEQDNSKLSKLDLTRDEGFLPLIAGTSDSEQISAQHSLGNTQEETKEMAAEPVVIRPRFLKPKEAEIT